jgi:hypothetical protein
MWINYTGGDRSAASTFVGQRVAMEPQQARADRWQGLPGAPAVLWIGSDSEKIGGELHRGSPSRHRFDPAARHSPQCFPV